MLFGKFHGFIPSVIIFYEAQKRKAIIFSPSLRMISKREAKEHFYQGLIDVFKEVLKQANFVGFQNKWPF